MPHNLHAPVTNPTRKVRTVIAEMVKAEELVLTCHVGPDGDALGSLLGVAWLARRQGKKIYASFGEPFTIPEAYRFLPVELLVPPGAVPAEPALMTSLTIATRFPRRCARRTGGRRYSTGNNVGPLPSPSDTKRSV